MPRVKYAFWTLSASKAEYGTPEGMSRLCRSFDDVWNRLRKVYGHLVYLRVVEIGHGGNIHFHVLVNRFISFDVINTHWSAVTGGSHTSFSVVDSHRVAYYLAKYISKSSQSNHVHEESLFLAHIRRVASSRSLLVEKKAIVEWCAMKFSRFYTPSEICQLLASQFYASTPNRLYEITQHSSTSLEINWS